MHASSSLIFASVLSASFSIKVQSVHKVAQPRKRKMQTNEMDATRNRHISTVWGTVAFSRVPTFREVKTFRNTRTGTTSGKAWCKSAAYALLSDPPEEQSDGCSVLCMARDLHSSTALKLRSSSF